MWSWLFACLQAVISVPRPSGMVGNGLWVAGAGGWNGPHGRSHAALSYTHGPRCEESIRVECLTATTLATETWYALPSYHLLRDIRWHSIDSKGGMADLNIKLAL